MARPKVVKVPRSSVPLSREDIADLQYRFKVCADGDDNGEPVDPVTATIAWLNGLDIIPNSELESIGFRLRRSATGTELVPNID